MKSIVYFFCLFLVSLQGFGQVNLVPNPSFEDTVFCPNGYSEIYACKEWMNFGETPDYFNSCAAIGGVNVPYSALGFQYSHSGNAMIGLIPYRQPNSPDGPNYRECVGSKLLSPLQIGVRYFISFYLNYSPLNPYQAVASNKVGLKLYTVSFDSLNSPPLDNMALLYSQIVIVDSVNWVRFSTSFVADSSYQYIAIGSFFDDSHTDTISLSDFPDASYYYIDDVCITTDSIYNESWTSIDHIDDNSDEIIVYPNPTNGQLIVKGKEVIEKINIYNNLGQLVMTTIQQATICNLDIKNLSEGSYFLDIFTNKTTIKKVIYLNY